MTTVLTPSPEAAAAFIRDGQLAAFPTETVYGLGADAFNAAAVRAIFAAKGRPADNPLIAHVACKTDVERLARDLAEPARRLMDAFFPGPLTLVLTRRPEVPAVVTAGLDTVGVRWPRHPVAQRFLEACRTPVAAPSANRSGRPSPTSAEAVRADLGGRIACILDGGRTEAGLESTVVDATGAAPVVLRPGMISLEQLRQACPDVRVNVDARTAPEEKKAPRSPGTRHRHYAPRARVVVVSGPQAAAPGACHAYIGRAAPDAPETFGRVRVCASLEDYARALFHFFRESDTAGCAVIYAEAVPEDGLGRALMDRLRRAAAR